MTTATEAPEELIKQFLTHLSGKGSSENTVTAYRRDLEQLQNFLWGSEGCTSWSETTQDSVEKFIQHLRGKQLRDSTIGRKLSVTKSFFSFLKGKGVLKSNPTGQIETPRSSKPLPQALALAQVDRLLEQPTKKATPAALRDSAMMEIVYATGLRITELVSLDLDSIPMDRENLSVTIHGKGAKHRTIPIHKQAVLALTRYLKEGRPRLPITKAERALFLNLKGERMTRQGFWLVLKQYGEGAKIDGTVTPDMLRHSFASHMLSGGAPIKQVQKLLGHAHISTTQVYTRITDEHIRRVYEKAHPRAG